MKHLTHRIWVMDSNRKILPNATIEAIPQKGSPVRLHNYQSTTEALVPLGEYTLRVAAEGFVSQERVVQLSYKGFREQFILGKEGMPYCYVGKKCIPFETRPNLIGIQLHKGISKEEEQALILSLAPFQVKDITEEGVSSKQFLRIYEIPRSSSSKEIKNLKAALTSNKHILKFGNLTNIHADQLSFFTDQFLVQFKPSSALGDIQELGKSSGFKVIRKIGNLPRTFLLKANDAEAETALQISNQLIEENLVQSAQVETISTFQAHQNVVPNDFLFDYQWYMPKVSIESAWQILHNRNPVVAAIGGPNDITYGNADTIIGLIDEGIPSAQITGPGLIPDHPEFSVNVSNNLPKVAAYYDFNFNQNHNNFVINPHGINCAGAIGATIHQLANRNGLVGAAPNTRIVSAISGAITTISIPEIFFWIAGLPSPSPAPLAQGAAILSNSWGGMLGLLPDFERTFEALTVYGRSGRGTAIFFSAGNSEHNSLTSPGTKNRAVALTTEPPQTDRVITIGACYGEVSERLTNYSSFGPEIDVVAPSNGPDLVSKHDPPTSYGAHTTAEWRSGDLPGWPASSQTVLSFPTSPASADIVVETTDGFVGGQYLIFDAPGSPHYAVEKILGVDNSRVITLLGTFTTSIPAGTIVRALATNDDIGRTYIDTAATIGELTLQVAEIAGFREGQNVLIGLPGGVDNEIKTVAIGGVDIVAKKLTFNAPLLHAHSVQNSLVPDVFAIIDSMETTITANVSTGDFFISVENTAMLNDTITNWLQLMFIPPSGAGINWGVASLVQITDEHTLKITPSAGQNYPIGTRVIANYPNYQINFGGTSFACPLTAGIGALILSANPLLTWVELRHILRSTADPIDENTPGFQGGDIDATEGRLQGIGIWYDAPNGGTPRVDPVTQVLDPIIDPVFSEWYGYGRVNAAVAVSAAFDYSHNHRDLMIRDHLLDDGTADTNVVLTPVQSPDIWVRRANTPISPSFDKKPPHQNPKLGQANYIFTRIKNRGTQEANLDCWVRFYIALSDGSNAAGINTPFLFPDDWNQDHAIADLPTNAGVKTTYYLDQIAIAPDEIEPASNDPNLFFDTDSSVHQIQVEWPATFHPPSNTPLKTFLLVQISPHDGNRNGLGAASNSNLSYREIIFAGWFFRNLLGNNLEQSLTVDGFGSLASMDFQIDLEVEVGTASTEKVTLMVERLASNGLVDSSANFQHDGTNWVLLDEDNNTPSWANINPPVITGTNTVASGDQAMLSFTGDINASNQHAKVILRGIIHSSLHSLSVPISETSYEIAISPQSTVSPQGIETAKEKKVPFHTFTDFDLLTAQSGSMNFGPVLGTAYTAYRTWSAFSSSGTLNAYAVVLGEFFIQEIPSTNLVNLVLKPDRQPKTLGSPILYYVYRGLKAGAFLDGSGQVLADNPSTNSDLLNRMWEVRTALNSSFGLSDNLEREDLGLHAPPSGTPLSGNTLVEEIFDTNDFQRLSPGWTIGTFETSGVFGFQVVVESPHHRLTLGDLRVLDHKIEITYTSGQTQYANGEEEDISSKIARSQILSFIDPVAYFGLLFDTEINLHKSDGSITALNAAADIFTDVIAKFATQDVVYVDIRDDLNHPLNFLGHYGDGTTQNDVVVPFADAGGSFVNKAYPDGFGWPILTLSNSDFTANSTDPAIALQLQLPVGPSGDPLAHNLYPILYLSGARFLTDFSAGNDRFEVLTAGSSFTNSFTLGIPNLPTQSKILPFYLKFHFSKRYDIDNLPTPSYPASVFIKDDYLDNLLQSSPIAVIPELPHTVWNSLQELQYVGWISLLEAGFLFRKGMAIDDMGQTVFAFIQGPAEIENGKTAYQAVKSNLDIEKGLKKAKSFFIALQDDLKLLDLSVFELDTVPPIKTIKSDARVNHYSIDQLNRSARDLFSIAFSTTEGNTIDDIANNGTGISGFDGFLAGSQYFFVVNNHKILNDAKDIPYFELELSLSGIVFDGTSFTHEIQKIDTQIKCYSLDGRHYFTEAYANALELELT